MPAAAIFGLVRRLLIIEGAESESQESQIEAAERVSSRLRAHLSNTIGSEGFRILLARAVAITARQFPRLNTVQVAPDGSLVGHRAVPSLDSHERLHTQDQADAAEGTVAIVANFLELLVTFIGEDLTARIVCSVWPEIATADKLSGEA